MTIGSVNLAGVTMKLTGDRRFTPRTTTTLSNGSYSFTNVPAGGPYTVTPSKTSYSFTPASRTYATLSGNISTANFAATLKTYNISGKIVRAGTTVGLSGVAVKVTASGFTTRTYTTSGNGVYTFTGYRRAKATRSADQDHYLYSNSESFPSLNANQPIGAATSFAGTGIAMSETTPNFTLFLVSLIRRPAMKEAKGLKACWKVCDEPSEGCAWGECFCEWRRHMLAREIFANSLRTANPGSFPSPNAPYSCSPLYGRMPDPTNSSSTRKGLAGAGARPWSYSKRPSTRRGWMTSPSMTCAARSLPGSGRLESTSTI